MLHLRPLQAAQRKMLSHTVCAGRLLVAPQMLRHVQETRLAGVWRPYWLQQPPPAAALNTNAR